MPTNDKAGAPANTEAFISGRQAGRNQFSPSLNPHPFGSAASIDWELGRQSVLLDEIDRAHGIQMLCIYDAAGCWCGGRGLCKDVA